MDRINSLPDDIICHTLSFLSTKEAALRSVLSKRWRNLFAFSTNLDLLLDKEDTRQSFIDFVDRVLAVSRNHPIETFTLKCRNGVLVDSAHITRWIMSVLNRGVLDLDIDLGIDAIDHGYSLPTEIFSCKTIVNMKLTGFVADVLPEDAFLPALKTLSLRSAKSLSFCTCVTVFPLCEKVDIHCVDGSTWKLSRTVS